LYPAAKIKIYLGGADSAVFKKYCNSITITL